MKTKLLSFLYIHFGFHSSKNQELAQGRTIVICYFSITNVVCVLCQLIGKKQNEEEIFIHRNEYKANLWLYELQSEVGLAQNYEIIFQDFNLLCCEYKFQLCVLHTKITTNFSLQEKSETLDIISQRQNYPSTSASSNYS